MCHTINLNFLKTWITKSLFIFNMTLNFFLQLCTELYRFFCLIFELILQLLDFFVELVNLFVILLLTWNILTKQVNNFTWGLKTWPVALINKLIWLNNLFLRVIFLIWHFSKILILITRIKLQIKRRLL